MRRDQTACHRCFLKTRTLGVETHAMIEDENEDDFPPKVITRHLTIP